MGKKTVRGHDIANRFVYSLNSNHYGCCFFWENNEKSFRKRMKKHAIFAKI